MGKRQLPDYWFTKCNRWVYVENQDGEIVQVPRWEPMPDWVKEPYNDPIWYGRYRVGHSGYAGWCHSTFDWDEAISGAKETLESLPEGGVVDILDLKTGKYAVADKETLHLVDRERLEDVENA